MYVYIYILYIYVYIYIYIYIFNNTVLVNKILFFNKIRHWCIGDYKLTNVVNILGYLLTYIIQLYKHRNLESET